MPLARAARFVGAFLSEPRGVGSILPSSPALSAALAEEAMKDRAGRPVLEIGAGTGSVTKALLDAGLAPRDLLTMERHPALHRALSKRLPHVSHALADAADAERVLAERGLRDPGVVVSGLPFLSIPREDRLCVLAGLAPLLRRGAVLLQFTYAAGRAPIPFEDFPEDLPMAAKTRRFVLRNLPPATIWEYKAAAAAGT